MLAAMQELAPAAFAEVEAIRAKNPQAAERLMDRIGPQLHPLVVHKDRNSPDFAAKKADLDAFVDVVRHGRLLAEERTGQNRPNIIAELRTELRAAIGKQVDARLRNQERQVDDLTKRSAKLREQLDRNRASRDKFIEDRLKEVADGEGRPPKAK